MKRAPEAVEPAGLLLLTLPMGGLLLIQGEGLLEAMGIFAPVGTTDFRSVINPLTLAYSLYISLVSTLILCLFLILTDQRLHRIIGSSGSPLALLFRERHALWHTLGRPLLRLSLFSLIHYYLLTTLLLMNPGRKGLCMTGALILQILILDRYRRERRMLSLLAIEYSRLTLPVLGTPDRRRITQTVIIAALSAVPQFLLLGCIRLILTSFAALPDRVLYHLIALLTLLRYSLFGAAALMIRLALTGELSYRGVPMILRQIPVRLLLPALFCFTLLYQTLYTEIENGFRPPAGNFEIMAHRGTVPGILENSLPGADRALKAGADRLELDLQYTADGRIVVFHDRSLKRLTGTGLRAAENSLHSLRLCRLPDGNPLLSLEEFLSHLDKTTPLNLELKNYAPDTGTAFVTALLEILETEGGTDIMISSLDYSLLKQIKDESDYPTAMIGLLCEGNLADYESDALVLLDWGLDPVTVSELHDRGKRIYAWSAGRSNSLESMYLMGIDGVISDDSARDRELLRELRSLSRRETMYRQYRALLL